jgi:hypothetical protein
MMGDRNSKGNQNIGMFKIRIDVKMQTKHAVKRLLSEQLPHFIHFVAYRSILRLSDSTVEPKYPLSMAPS